MLFEDQRAFNYDSNGDSWVSQITSELTKGFDKLTGAMSGMSNTFNGFGAEQAKLSGSMTGFFSKSLGMSMTRNTLLSSVDSTLKSHASTVDAHLIAVEKSIDAQTSTIREGFARVDANLSYITSVLSQQQALQDQMMSAMQDLGDITVAAPDITVESPNSSPLYLPAPVVNMDTRSFESGISALQDSQANTFEFIHDQLPVLDNIYAQLEGFHEDYVVGTAGLAQKIDAASSSISSATASASSSSSGSIISSITSSSSSSSATNAASTTSGFKGALKNIGGSLLTSAGNGLTRLLQNTIPQWIGQQVNMFRENTNSLAYRGGLKTEDAAARTNSIIAAGRAKNQGSGILGRGGYLIDNKTYYDSLQKALDAGMSHVQDLEGITADLALNAKLLPDMVMDLSEGYAKDLLVQTDYGSDAIRSVSMVIKDYSDNMYVSSQKLQKGVEKYHTTVVGMTKNMTSYVKMMGEYIKVLSALDENGLENLSFEELAEKFMYTPLSEWSDEMFKKAAAYGLNGADIRALNTEALTDPEGAYERVLSRFSDKLSPIYEQAIEGIENGDASSFNRLKEYAGLGSVDVREIMKALQKEPGGESALDRALDQIRNGEFGSSITGANTAEDMTAATDAFAEQTLTEQTNLTIEDTLSNIFETLTTGDGWLAKISEGIYNMGLSGNLMSAALGAVGGFVGRKLISKVGGKLMGKLTGKAGTEAAEAASKAAVKKGITSNADEAAKVLASSSDEVAASATKASSGLTKFTDKLRGTGKVGSKVADKIDDGAAFVSKGITKFRSTASKAGTAISAKAGQAFSKLPKGMQTALSGAKSKLVDFGTSAKSIVSKGLDGAKGAFSKGLEGLKSVTSKGFEGMKTIAGKGLAKFGDDAAGLLSKGAAKIEGQFPKLAKGLENVGSKLASKGAGVVDDGVELIAKGGDDILNAGSKLVAKNGDDVLKAGEKIIASTGDDVAKLGTKGVTKAAGAGAKAAGAIVGVALDLGAGVNKTEEWFGEGAGNDKTIAAGIGGALGGEGSGIFSDKESTAEKAMDIGSGALKGAGVGAAIGSVVPVIGTAIGGAIGAGVGAIGSAIGGENIAKFVGDIGDGLQDFNQGVDDFLADNLGGVGKGISAVKNTALSVTGDWVGGAFNAVGDVVGGVTDGIGNIVGGIGDGIGKITQGDVLGGLGDMGMGLVNGVGSVVGGVVDGVASVGKGIWDGVCDIGKGIGDFFSGLFGGAEETAEEKLDEFNESMGEMEDIPTPDLDLTGANATVAYADQAELPEDITYYDSATMADNGTAQYNSGWNAPGLNSLNQFGYVDPTMYNGGSVEDSLEYLKLKNPNTVTGDTQFDESVPFVGNEIDPETLMPSDITSNTITSPDITSETPLSTEESLLSEIRDYVKTISETIIPVDMSEVVSDTKDQLPEDELSTENSQYYKKLGMELDSIDSSASMQSVLSQEEPAITPEDTVSVEEPKGFFDNLLGGVDSFLSTVNPLYGGIKNMISDATTSEEEQKGFFDNLLSGVDTALSFNPLYRGAKGLLSGGVDEGIKNVAEGNPLIKGIGDWIKESPLVSSVRDFVDNNEIIQGAKEAIFNNPISKGISDFVGGISVIGDLAKGMGDVAANIFDPLHLFHSDDDASTASTLEYPEDSAISENSETLPPQESSNPIVDAIVTMQNSITTRLDAMMSHKSQKEYQQHDYTPSLLGKSDESIKDQDIRKYVM